jgi:hypothetical protein
MLAFDNAEVLTAASLLLSGLQIEFQRKLVGFVKIAAEVGKTALVSLGS